MSTYPSISVSIDTGGTFTDVYFTYCPSASVLPVSSVSKHLTHSASASSIIRGLVAEHVPPEHARHFLTSEGGVIAREDGRMRISMGTTCCTNALLERTGSSTLLMVTRGFRDIVEVGDQTRDSIFDLSCSKSKGVIGKVLEVDERVVCGHVPSSTRNSVSRVTGEKMCVRQPLDVRGLRRAVEEVIERGDYDAVAVCYMNSYLFPDHEIETVNMLESLGKFKVIKCSSDVSNVVKYVPRCETVCVSSYLQASLNSYMSGVSLGFTKDSSVDKSIKYMKSDGTVTTSEKFASHEAVLSGPAGGLVALSKAVYGRYFADDSRDAPRPVIGFDMGGTSTDVTRYAGSLPLLHSSKVSGVTFQTPTLDINTVASGGGSALSYSNGTYVVGPRSVGSYPGPVCYNNGGHTLSVTDANVVCGRIVAERFPNIFGPGKDEPANFELSKERFLDLIRDNEIPGQVESVAMGYIKVANELMCRSIRKITNVRGHQPSEHVLCAFGGAGPQHACMVARSLGISRVVIHKRGGVLSAFGLTLSDSACERSAPTNEKCARGAEGEVVIDREKYRKLRDFCVNNLEEQGHDRADIQYEYYLNLRYDGTDNSIYVKSSSSDLESSCLNFWGTYAEDFESGYAREYGFKMSTRDIVIDDYRVRCVVVAPTPGVNPSAIRSKVIGEPSDDAKVKIQRCYFEGGWRQVVVWDLKMIKPGMLVKVSTTCFALHCLSLFFLHDQKRKLSARKRC